MADTKAKLLKDIESFLVDNKNANKDKISETSFSIKVAKTPNLISRLRAGKDVTTSTLDSCYSFINDWYSSKA